MQYFPFLLHCPVSLFRVFSSFHLWGGIIAEEIHFDRSLLTHLKALRAFKLGN